MDNIPAGFTDRALAQVLDTGVTVIDKDRMTDYIMRARKELGD